MQGINFNQRPTSNAGRIPRATLFRGDSRSVGSMSASSLWFFQTVPGVCCSTSVPSRVSVMRSPLELSIEPSAEGSFSHLHPLPVARPGCPAPPVVEGWHSRDSLYYPIQWVESKDGATWELIRGLGYSGSSLLSKPIFGKPPL